MLNKLRNLDEEYDIKVSSVPYLPDSIVYKPQDQSIKNHINSLKKSPN